MLTLAAYGVGGVTFWWFAKERGIGTQGVARLAIIGFVSGILGAKIIQWLSEGWPITIPISAIAVPMSGGRSLLGGLICGWLAVEIAKRRMGIQRSTGDAFALALAAGETIGRLGCHFNPCCIGVPYSGPLAVVQHGESRFPAQLFSAVVSALIFGGLWFARRRLSREGDVFKLYLICFAASRLVLEFARQRELGFAGLSMMQWFCIELLITVPIWAMVMRRRLRSSDTRLNS